MTGKWGTQTGETQAIVKELLDCGADRLVRGEGIDRTWTPIKTAKYYRIDNEILELLAPKAEDFDKSKDNDRDWNWLLGGGKRGILDGDDSGWCDHCLLVRLTFVFTSQCSWFKTFLVLKLVKVTN